MGSNSSKSYKQTCAQSVEARNSRVRNELRLYEEQQEAWRAAQLLDKHHREQRLQEEEKLRRNREEWLRQEHLKEYQEQQKILREQEIRTQNIRPVKEIWESRPVQREQLVQKTAPWPQQHVPVVSPTPSSPVSFSPMEPKATGHTKIYPSLASMSPPQVSSQPEVPPLMSRPKSSVPSEPEVSPLMLLTVAPAMPEPTVPPLFSIPKGPQKSLKSRKAKVFTSKKVASKLPSECNESPESYHALKSQKAKVFTSKKVASRLPSECNESPESYHARYASPQFPFVKWTDIDYIQEAHGISRYVVENIMALFKNNNTIPFIARYRKTTTLGMEADQLRNIKNSAEQAELIKQKADALIEHLDKQGRCNSQLYAFLQSTKSLHDLEFIKSIVNLSKTEVERGQKSGLLEAAESIVAGQPIPGLSYYIEPHSAGLKTEEQVKTVLISLIAGIICKEPKTLGTITILRKKYPVSIETNKYGDTENKEELGRDKKKKPNRRSKMDYQIYFNFSSFSNNIKPHQVLEINRCESQKIIKVKIIVPDRFERDFKEFCAKGYENACRTSEPCNGILNMAFDFAWSSIVKSKILQVTRQELKCKAEIATIANIPKSVKQILLQPPVRNQVILGIQPGFQIGCKLAVISEQGEVLQTGTIYPHDADNPRAKHEAQGVLSEIILAHKCSIFALGDGAACRETEVFLSELIEKTEFKPLHIVYAIVDNSPARFYSTTPESSMEFPYLDSSFRAAISLARRLQDPMAELVKIDAQHLGVGMYQHDLPKKQLATKLNEVIMEAVSFVGVDVNTASVSLLKRVAGLGDSRANHIIEWRKSSGPFRTRSDLMKVPQISSKTFEQCAGFIRIMPETSIGSDDRAVKESFNYLDQTWIHPESYDVAKAFINAAKLNAAHIGTKSFIDGVSRFANQGCDVLAQKFHTTVETIKIIVEGLSIEKGQDIRGNADKSMFRESLTSLDDLKVGTLLTGVVRNNTHFGAFVDVGVEKSGLIHTSQMGGMTLSVGQRVETKVLNVEKSRGRLGLALVKCF